MNKMLRYCFLTFVISALFINIFAQDFSINTNADFVSRYVWRGLNLNDQPCIQPYLTAKVSNFQIGFWGSYGFTNINPTDPQNAVNSEIDTWMSYSVNFPNSISLTAILTDYYYPNGGKKIGNFNNYNNANGPGAHTVEAGLIINGPEKFPISLSGYMNVYNEEGKNVYLQLDYGFEVQSTNLGLSLGTALGSKDNPYYYGTEKLNVINFGIKASRQIKITEEYSLPIFISYTLNPNAEISYLVFGLTF